MKQFNTIRGMKALNTIGGLKRRASNGDRTQAHLDLYVLVQERDRLEKEKYQVLSRLRVINERLKTIDGRIKELKSISDWGHSHAGGQGGSQKRRVADDKEDGKTWQVKNLQY